MIDLKTFREARELYLNESLSKDGNEKLYEFFAEKYSGSETLNEGLFSAIVSWFKRNFSPRAAKIKSLGNEYYDWLISEYKANYKGSERETELDKFLREEKISSDIESQINAEAEGDEDYQDLAKAVILENKVKAKKDFSTKILGSDSSLTKKFESDLNRASSDVRNITDSLSKEEAKTFQDRLKDLTALIKKDGKNSDVASKIAAGILVYAQNRKNLIYKDYDSDDLEKDYNSVEKVLLSVKKDLNNVRGAEIIYCIRSFKEKSLLEKKLDAKILGEEIDKVTKELKDIGVSIDKNWGLAELYLRQPSEEDRKKVLKIIQEKVKGLSDSEKENLASSTEEQINKIDAQTDDTDKQNAALDKLETEISQEQSPDKEKLEKQISDAKLEYDKASEAKQKADAGDDEEKKVEAEKAVIQAKLEWFKLKEEQAKKYVKDPEELLKGYKEEVELLMKRKVELEKKTPTSSTQAAEKESFPNVEKILKSLETNDAIPYAIKTAAISIASCEEKSGKFYLSPKLKSDAVIKTIYSTSDVIDQSLVEFFKKEYIESLDTEDLAKTKLKEPAVKKASESLMKDIINATQKYKEGIEFAPKEQRDEVFKQSGIMKMFLDKKGSLEPLKEDELEKIFLPIFKYEIPDILNPKKQDTSAEKKEETQPPTEKKEETSTPSQVSAEKKEETSASGETPSKVESAESQSQESSKEQSTSKPPFSRKIKLPRKMKKQKKS